LIKIPTLSKYIDGINARPLPEMKISTREFLREVYAPKIANLEKMLNRDLTIWNT